MKGILIIMTVVLQRVKSASVIADGIKTGEINNGLLLLLGVKQGDTENDAIKLAKKTANLRIFCDENDKMNLSVIDISGAVLVISNFTLLANYSHGNRPDYFNACQPERANELYGFFTEEMKKYVPNVQNGVFGADMEVSIVNDGPVTIIMESDKLK